MDSHRWEQIQALFHAAAALPASRREDFLRAKCGDDKALISEVLAMIAQDEHGSSILDGDVAHVAHRILSENDRLSFLFKEFGPYHTTKVLGEGGMGVVYLAERKDLGSLVAIKVLRDAWLSPARHERFVSEQRTLAQLNHPGIARLYDADTLTDGTPWFVMEYVEGMSLTEYCGKNQCSATETLLLFRAVCEAVQYAHSHAVIHRDLKPSNIFVKSDGSVRLLDFGIAKQLESLDMPVDQTMTGLRLMTPAYAAPERIRGERVGIQTDVYSLGVILYELLAGQLPFELANLTPGEAATILTEHEPGRPSAAAKRHARHSSSNWRLCNLNKAEWADLDVLCLTAMHKDPRRRYRSVEALIRDIDHYLKGEPLESRPDSLRYRVGKFVTRNRRPVLATAIVTAMIVGLVAFFTFRITKARDAALAEAARTERIQEFMMDLFQGGDESTGPSDQLRVITLVDRGAEEAQVLNNDPKIQSELYETLGEIYEQLGKYDRSDSLLHSALEERKKVFGAESPEVAESLVAIGLLRSDQGKFDEAEQLVQQGLDIGRKVLPADHPAIAKYISSLGTILENRGNYPQAITLLKEAVKMQSEEDPDSSALSSSLTELANSNFYAGHYDVSDALNRQVLAMDRKLYGDRHPNVAQDLINLAAIQLEHGDYKQAEDYDRQALDIIQSFYGPDHPETASTLTVLGRVLVTEGKGKDAEKMLKKALAVEQKVYGNMHPRVASTLDELGKIAWQEGKLDEATAYFTQMLKIYRAAYSGKHYYIGVALSNLAGVYATKKNYTKAEQLFHQALHMYAETLPANHLYTGIAHIKLGRILVEDHHYVAAKIETMAGYDILRKQAKPAARWIQDAQQDLAREYTALNQPQKAAELRAQLSAENSSPASSNKD